MFSSLYIWLISSPSFSQYFYPSPLSQTQNKKIIFQLGECPCVAVAPKSIVVINIIVPLHVLSNNPKWAIMDLIFLSHPLNRFLHACSLTPHLYCFLGRQSKKIVNPNAITKMLSVDVNLKAKPIRTSWF
jgi:hypothetical protein